MLFLFFTTAQILVFLKAFLMNFDSNSFAVSSLKIASDSIFGFNYSAEPGKIQHIFSSSLSVRGESTVKVEGIVLSFSVAKREGRIVIDVPLESKPFRLSSSTIETITPSSSETTSTAPSELSMLVSCIVPSKKKFKRGSASVSRVP